MDPERGLKSVKVDVELPLEVQIVQPKKTCRHRRRVFAAGIFIGAALLFAHKGYAFAPGPWSLDDHIDHFGYHESGFPTGKAAEEIFL
jgi:hypothetical protein